jgi:hypothetical protein
VHVGAHTPEELETLLEDAFLMRDRRGIAELFERGAVLSGDDATVAHGRSEILHAAAALWARERPYVAAPLHVLQTCRTALIAGRHATSVAHRSEEGLWRFEITLLHP